MFDFFEIPLVLKILRFSQTWFQLCRRPVPTVPPRVVQHLFVFQHGLHNRCIILLRRFYSTLTENCSDLAAPCVTLSMNRPQVESAWALGSSKLHPQKTTARKPQPKRELRKSQQPQNQRGGGETNQTPPRASHPKHRRNHRRR